MIALWNWIKRVVEVMAEARAARLEWVRKNGGVGFWY